MERGEITSEQLVRSCLERIHDREETVQAWSYVDEAGAIARARQCDDSPRRGPLHGIPVGIKDIVDTSDMPTERGEPEIYRGRQPDTDATLVAHLREAGAVILGKTAPSKHTIMLPGKTRNPHDPTRTPGASSSGSAAAVADFMVPVTVCSQTAGSILRPATYCGVVGFKPTKDTVVYDGTRTYSPHLDTLGSMGRSVADATMLMQGMTGDTTFDPAARHDGPLRVGLYRTPYYDDAEPYVRDLFEQSAKVLEAAGIEVRDADMPVEFDALSELQDVIMSYDLDKVFADHRRDYPELMDPELIAYCAKGAQVTPERYQEALDHAARCRNLLDEAMGDLDVLLTPGHPHRRSADHHDRHVGVHPHLDVPAHPGDLAAHRPVAPGPSHRQPAGGAPRRRPPVPGRRRAGGRGARAPGLSPNFTRTRPRPRLPTRRGRGLCLPG